MSETRPHADVPRPRNRWPLLRWLLHRVPFTATLIPAVLVVSAAAGLLGRPIATSQLARWGFGLDDILHGEWWRLLSAPFLVLKPYMALTISAILLFFVGTCELMLRTRRTLLVFATSHVAGYVGALGLLSLLGDFGFARAAALATHRDVGASNGAFGTAGALLLFLPASLRTTGILLIAAYLSGSMVIEEQLWNVQHVLAFVTGLAMGLIFLVRDRAALGGLAPSIPVLHRQRPYLMAWIVGGMGAVNVLAAILLPHHAGFERLEAVLPLGLVHAPRHLLLFVGLLLLLLAGGLRRAQRAAWWAAFAALLLTLVLQLELGITKIEALFALSFLLLLVAWKEEFRAPSHPVSQRAARRGLLWLLVLVPGLAWLVTLALRENFSAFPGPAAAFVAVVRRVVFLDAPRLVPATHKEAWLLQTIPLVFWSGLLVVVVRLLRAARAPRPVASERQRARELVLDQGRTSTAFMTTWRGNSYFFGSGNLSFLAYRVHSGVAVVLGDPTGPAALRGSTLHDFGAFCQGRGWSHVVLAATEAERSRYDEAGYRLLQIGEEAVLPLEGLQFRGRKWQNTRTAVNRARKEGVEFILVEGGHVPLELETQFFDISRDWERTQRLPPMEFTLGTTQDVRDPAVEVAAAVDRSGRVHGFVDWLPIPAERGWVIDLMRRRPDAMGGTMEFLIGMSLLAFQQRGDRFASLATAPLVDLDRANEENLLPRVLGAVFSNFQTYYDFRSLFDFKDRFQPRWEPVYLAYHDPAELPGAAVAIVRAHLPHLGWVDAVRLFGQSLAERLRPATEPEETGPTP